MDGPQKIALVDTFYRGLPPDDVAYIYRAQTALLAQPLVQGATRVVLNEEIPKSCIWDVSGLQFFMSFPSGTEFVDTPDDYARASFSFSILRNDNDAISTQTDNQNLVPDRYAGFDVLGENVLSLFGDTPAHLIFPAGSTLKIEVTVINALVPVPSGLRAGVRLTARQIDAVRWEQMKR